LCLLCLLSVCPTGAVVAAQWPNPRILCYKTSYSDMPSNSLRSCCSLYSLNLGFTVFWLLVFAIMVIARDVVRIVICLCFWVVHVLVVIIFRYVSVQEMQLAHQRIWDMTETAAGRQAHVAHAVGLQQMLQHMQGLQLCCSTP
jgi:hypothetical protein